MSVIPAHYTPLVITLGPNQDLLNHQPVVKRFTHQDGLESGSVTTNMPSLRDHASFIRPSTRDRANRPSTGEHIDHSLVIPSRTSSLHSRITQPIPSTLQIKPNQRTPKTLTHAYMVCGVGREPSQWVRAPPPPQGKIGHMRGAIGQFWLPEILGSSPRLEHDNESARALYAAMRVSPPCRLLMHQLNHSRHASLTMSRSVPVEASLNASTTPSFYSKIHHTLCMVSP